MYWLPVSNIIIHILQYLLIWGVYIHNVSGTSTKLILSYPGPISGDTQIDPRHLWTPSIHPRCTQDSFLLQSESLSKISCYTPGGWVVVLRGPICKIARFQAELIFTSWAECGKNQDQKLSIFGVQKAAAPKVG